MVNRKYVPKLYRVELLYALLHNAKAEVEPGHVLEDDSSIKEPELEPNGV